MLVTLWVKRLGCDAAHWLKEFHSLYLPVIRRLMFVGGLRYKRATIKKASSASIPGNTEKAPLRYWAQGSPHILEIAETMLNMRHE